MNKELKEIGKMMHKHENFNKKKLYKEPRKSFGAKKYSNKNAEFTKVA